MRCGLLVAAACKLVERWRGLFPVLQRVLDHSCSHTHFLVGGTAWAGQWHFRERIHEVIELRITLRSAALEDRRNTLRGCCDCHSEARAQNESCHMCGGGWAGAIRGGINAIVARR